MKQVSEQNSIVGLSVTGKSIRKSPSPSKAKGKTKSPILVKKKDLEDDT